MLNSHEVHPSSGCLLHRSSTHERLDATATAAEELQCLTSQPRSRETAKWGVSSSNLHG